MRIPVIDALVEKREEKKRKAKLHKILRWTIAIVAAVLVLFSFIVSLVNMIERWVQNREERRRRFRACADKLKAFAGKIKEKLPSKKREQVYYVDGFSDQTEEADEDAEMF